MIKKVFDEVDYHKCPYCGNDTGEWVESQIDRDEETYCDSYVCLLCDKQYDIVFDLKYKCHYI